MYYFLAVVNVYSLLCTRLKIPFHSTESTPESVEFIFNKCYEKLPYSLKSV